MIDIFGNPMIYQIMGQNVDEMSREQAIDALKMCIRMIDGQAKITAFNAELRQIAAHRQAVGH